MITQLSNRRPRAYGEGDGLPEPDLERPFLTTGYSTSSTYLSTSPIEIIPEQLAVFTPPVPFTGLPVQQDAFGYSQHYPAHHQNYRDAPQHFSHYQNAAVQHHSDHSIDNIPRKRQRRTQEDGVNMPWFPFSSCDTLQDDEKSPEHDFLDEEACRPGSIVARGATAVFNSLSGTCQPHNSNYADPASYQPLQESHQRTSHALSADLMSPMGMPPPSDWSLRGNEQPRALVNAGYTVDSERLPLLPPHPEMHYQAPMSNLKLDVYSPAPKMERPAQDFRDNNIHANSMFMHHVETQSPSGMAQTDSGYYTAHNTADRYSTVNYGFTASPTFDSQQGVQCAYFPTLSHESEPPMNHKPTPTRRGPFKNKEARDKTAVTRRIGSCIRCRMQRIRCEIDEYAPDDENAPCECCKKIIANSKVFRMPCRRWKLVDVRLYKPDNVETLRWTRRWKDTTAMPEIVQWLDSKEDIKWITLDDGLHIGVNVLVRRFLLMEGDVRERTWGMETIQTEDYALVDVAAVKTAYEKHLSDIRLLMLSEREGSRTASQQKNFEELLGKRNGLVWETYHQASRRRDDESVSAGERDLLTKVLDLWVAVRLTTRSFEISGGDSLGMREVKGKVLLPPVMGRQLDKILLDHTLTKLRRETLDQLQKMTHEKKQKTWMTTYLVTFMLLHNVSLITDHDKNYARKHALKLKISEDKSPIWARPQSVQQYHQGANILLAYFHYCNRGTYPFSSDCKDSDLQNLAELDGNAIKFVIWTRSEAERNKKQWKALRDSGFDHISTHEHIAEEQANDYSDPFFFVSQLYELNWTPRDTNVNQTSCRSIAQSDETSVKGRSAAAGSRAGQRNYAVARPPVAL